MKIKKEDVKNYKEYSNLIKNEEYDIPDVLPKIEVVAYNKKFNVNTKPKKNFFTRPIIKFASIILIIGLVLTVTLLVGNANKEYGHKLENLSNKQNLSKVVNQSKKYQETPFEINFGCSKDKSTSVDTMNNVDNQPNSNVNSTTNNQVENVYEPEIIQYDNKYIYFLYYNQVIIYKRDTNITHHKTIILEKSNSTNKSTMLIKDNKLIIYYIGNSQRNCTYVKIYDTLNEFKIIKQYEISGSYQDARLYNNSLYIVTTEPIVESTAYTPYVKDGSSTINKSFDNIIYITNTLNLSYTTISTINLETYSIHQNAQLGAVNYTTIYMSEKRIYLVSTIHNGKKEVKETTIYIYDINPSDTSFYSFINFDGYILDQYSLDEYNNMLRVASTNPKEEINKYNSIHIYDLSNKELNRIGLLNEGLGKPGQLIKSVNFNKEHANVVTYYNMDPLYDIDLSDPKNPKIIGTLEAPGYSSYLHRFNDTYMLGIGYDDFRKPKLSLYKNVKGVYTSVGQDYNFYDEHKQEYIISNYAFDKPRELMFTQVDNVMTFGMPVQTAANLSSSQYKFEYWIFQIDLDDNENPIKLKLKINSDLFGVKLSNTYITYSPTHWNEYTYNLAVLQYGFLRGLYLDDQYIGISSKGIAVYDKEFNLLYTEEVNDK